MMKDTARPNLRQVPIEEVLPPRGKQVVLTISVGQEMSAVHRVGYDAGWYVLELDDDERPVRAYHRGTPC